MGAGTVDLIVLALLGGLLLYGVIRGFVHQLAGVLFLVVGIFVARRYYLDLAAVLQKAFDLGKPIDEFAGFAGILVGVIVIGALVAILLRGALEKLKLLAYDRFLGGVLGALKGALVVVLAQNVMMDLLGSEGSIPEAIDESVSWSVSKPVMEKALPLLPEAFREKLREGRDKVKPSAKPDELPDEGSGD